MTFIIFTSHHACQNRDFSVTGDKKKQSQHLGERHLFWKITQNRNTKKCNFVFSRCRGWVNGEIICRQKCHTNWQKFVNLLWENVEKHSSAEYWGIQCCLLSMNMSDIILFLFFFWFKLLRSYYIPNYLSHGWFALCSILVWEEKTGNFNYFWFCRNMRQRTKRTTALVTAKYHHDARVWGVAH